ncbi:MAG: gliding motility-associated protein GldE [Cytophagales bacterium]|nr:gliding motility-associated protein GldE [Cytophagales bacterium]MDW8383670.1 gliding motility-associated protein GldE [Flammeovirgaceae bacterium]
MESSKLIFLTSSPSVYSLFIVIGILLAASALISGSEVAFFSLSQVQLANLRKSNKPADKHILRLTENPKLLLATILMLNNTVNVGIVTISTFLSWELLGKNSENAIFIVSIVVTILLVFFGEILPKVYVTQYNLTFARWVARFFIVATRLMQPFATLLNRISGGIEQRLRRKNKKMAVSAKELEEAVEMTTAQATTEEEKEILKGIVKFGTKTVKQIMQTRLDIAAIDIETDFHELMDKINKWEYSRLPVYRNTIDSIEGILYVKDILPYLEESEKFRWQDLIRRNVLFVPDSKRIDDLFKDFQSKHVHIAIVVDEYGGTVGLVTMEDIIEEIVGEINDEFDNDVSLYKQIGENIYQFDAKISLIDFCKILETDHAIFEEAKGESESLGGLLLELFQYLPKTGEKITFQHFKFTVIAVTKKRIKTVRVEILPSSSTELKEFEPAK